MEKPWGHKKYYVTKEELVINYWRRIDLVNDIVIGDIFSMAIDSILQIKIMNLSFWAFLFENDAFQHSKYLESLFLIYRGGTTETIGNFKAIISRSTSASNYPYHWKFLNQ